MSDHERIAIAYSALCESFGRQMTKAGLAMAVRSLSDLPSQAVANACLQAQRTCRYPPTVAEIRELAGEVSHRDRAMMAYAAFERAVEQLGGYRSPDFDDPVINATVRHLGGWSSLCATPSRDFDRFVRPQFLKTYESLSRVGIDGEVCRPLVGDFERINASTGHRRLADCVPVRTGLPWASRRPAIGSYGVSNGSVSMPHVEVKKP